MVCTPRVTRLSWIIKPVPVQNKSSFRVIYHYNCSSPSSSISSPSRNQDLTADLKYELTGKFERLIVGLMRPPAYADAKEIKDAISVRSRVSVCEGWGCGHGEIAASTVEIQ